MSVDPVLFHPPSPQGVMQRFVVAHDLAVVFDGVELVRVHEERHVARLERREHPGNVWHVNVARPELDLVGLAGNSKF